MNYPEALIVDGAEYDINTGYEYALACFACINDPDISDYERAYGVISLLYKEPPANLDGALRMAVKYLQLGRETADGDRVPDMDFDYDMHYIRSSFRSDFGIDLNRTEDMHWWEFAELLQGLTDDSILNRVRDLRNYDLSTIKDGKARNKIAKAQAALALPKRISQEDQDTLNAFYKQLK